MKRDFLKKSSASKAAELLSMNRNQLLTGHLFKLALVNSPKCDIWKQVTEMDSRSLWPWGFGCQKIQVPGSIFHETRWLWRHFYQQDIALCSRYGAVGCKII